ncbi:MAG TPA: hydroxymethylbilane synthase [Candidatus Saccharimonadales bacterium]|jgi:hydroxymethylbilane synthase
MTDLKQLTAGTRGSPMALTQTGRVIAQLTKRHPELMVTTKTITTKGDVDDTPIPLDTVGKAWFTKEIEQELLDKNIDFAVHSLKDVPPELPPGLTVLPILPRDDPRDGLVATAATTLATLPKGATVGTDSLRRKALLLQERPDLNVQSIRGNANTRLQKLEAGDFDALVMAVAGLERIGRIEMVVEYLDPTTFVPSIGQGALAVEVRTERTDLTALFKELQDEACVQATAAEQAFAEVIGGGCKLPVACYVRIEAGTAHAYGMVGSMDASKCVVASLRGSAAEASALARQLARKLAKEPFVVEYA